MFLIVGIFGTISIVANAAAYTPKAGSERSGAYNTVYAYYHQNLSTINGNIVTGSHVGLKEGKYDSGWINDIAWRSIYQGRRAYVSKLNNLLYTAKGYWYFDY